MSYDKIWVERSARSTSEVSAQEVALKDTYLQAQKIAFHLVCASNCLDHGDSAEVTSCARVVREALRKPEKERATAVKAANEAVLSRQMKYVVAHTSFQEYQEDWLRIRATLVSQLEAVANDTKASYLGADLLLNCEAVEELIDYCDGIVSESANKRCSRGAQKLAEAAFDKVFATLASTVRDANWVSHAASSCLSFMATDPLFGDLVLDGAPATVPDGLPKCAALDAARKLFESAFENGTYNACRDFRESTRGSLNEAHSAEALLSAMPDIAAMLRADAERDRRLRTYGRSRTFVRNRVEQVLETFGNVCRALPEAVDEAAIIEGTDQRRRAQSLCLFAANRLKVNWSYVRECDRWVGSHEDTDQDVRGALERKHGALVERIKGKRLQQAVGTCCYRSQS